MNSEEISYERIVQLLHEDNFVLLKMRELWFIAGTDSLLLHSFSKCGPPTTYPTIAIGTSNPAIHSPVHPRVQTMLSFYDENIWYRGEGSKDFYITRDNWVLDWDEQEKNPIYLLLICDVTAALPILEKHILGSANINALSRMRKSVNNNIKHPKTSELPLVISADIDGNLIFLTE